MRTQIKNKRSKLMVRKGYRDIEEFNFPLDTLKDWYPLNVNYEYKYSMDRKDLYLTLSDTYATYYDYGVETKNRAKAPGNRFCPSEGWYNPSVKEDNERISNLAEEWEVVNFYTPEEEVTWLAIEDSYETLLDEYEDIKEVLYKRASKYVDGIALDHEEEEEQDRYIYMFATEEELNKLHDIGKMYVMVGLLKRIKQAGV